MIEKTQNWSKSRRLDDNGETVNCRVGVHTGSCTGGMVGTEMQRYHLFGHFMSCLEGLESTAPAGRVQVSTACKDSVECQRRTGSLPSDFDFDCLDFEDREGQLTTSKGEVVPIEDVGGAPTYVLSYSGPTGASVTATKSRKSLKRPSELRVGGSI